MAPVSSSAAGSPYVRAKRQRRQQQILHSALRAFRRQGYHPTTLEQIADALGIRSTALYHYFPDKEAILYACHREGLAEVARILEEAERRFTTAAERLRHVIREHVRVMTETLEGSALALEVTSLSPAHRREVIAGRDRYEQAVRGLIAQGIAAGEFRRVDPKIAAFAMFGAINWIVRWFRSPPEGPVSPAALGEQFADFLVTGLGHP